MKKLMVMFCFMLSIIISGQFVSSNIIHAEDVWVGTEETQSSICNVWLDTNSIKKIATDYRQCKLKWVYENGDFLTSRYVSYFIHGVGLPDGRQGRTWHYYVSKNEPTVQDSFENRRLLRQAPEYYQCAFEYIRNRT